MNVFGDEQDLVSRFLIRYGEWADLEIEFISEAVTDDIAVADIGAYLGTFGLGLSRRRRLERVHFVEANGLVAPLLRANVERNCKTSWTVETTLVAPDGAGITCGVSEPGNLGGTSFNSVTLGRNLQAISAPDKRKTLLELRREHGDFGLIKLDVEGMELAILESDADYVRAGRCVIWCECNEQASSLSLARFLLTCKCAIYYFAFPAFNAGNFNKSDDPIFPFAFEAGLLALPSDGILRFDARARGCLLVRIQSIEDLKRALWNTPRWAPREWWGQLPEGIIAQASRYMLGQSYENFLSDGDDKASQQAENPLAAVLVRTELRLAEAEEVASAYLSGISETAQALRGREIELANAFAKQTEDERLLIESDARLAESQRMLDALRQEVEASAAEVQRLTQVSIRQGRVRRRVLLASQDVLLKFTHARATEAAFLAVGRLAAQAKKRRSLHQLQLEKVDPEDHLDAKLKYLEEARLWAERLAEDRLKLLVQMSRRRPGIVERFSDWLRKLSARGPRP
jgi:FkbM family methyltransferase